MVRSRYEKLVDACPAGWERVRLDALGQIHAGGTPSRNNPAFWGGSIPWVTPSELTQLRGKWLDGTRECITEAGLSASAAVLMPKGSLLVTTRATVGAVAVARSGVATNQGFKSIVPDEASDEGFYYHYLTSAAAEMQRLASGSTFLEISRREFAAIRVPRPPVVEQRGIAEILDAADAAIQQTEKVIEKLRLTRRGLNQALLTRGLDEQGQLRTEPGEFKSTAIGLVPSDWNVGGLASQAHPERPYLKTGPFGSSLKGEHWVAEGVPVITIGSLGEGEFISSELLFVSPAKAASLSDYALRPGDLVFSRVADVGRSAVVTAREDEWIMSSNLMRISLDPARVVPAFAHLAIVEGETARKQLKRFVNSGGREVANTAVLDEIRFAWPPKTEQERIVAVIDSQDARLRAEEAHRDKLKLLKKGLMDDLLTGRVRVLA